MAFVHRRIVCGALATAVAFAFCLTVAAAAIDRPNGLDRRVDAISQAALLDRPATALVDPNRQAAALRRVDWTLPGLVLMVLFEAGALLYFWSSGGAAALRDRLRRRMRSEGSVRFCFGATLALIARAAALLPAFYLYRVDRVMGLTVELTRFWALFYGAHTLLAMAIAGIIAMVVLGLVARTHQWYAYTIVGILAASVAWAYASPYFELSPFRTVAPVSGRLETQLDAILARAGLPDLPVVVETSRNSVAGGAVVLGLGDSRRIVLRDTLIAGDTPAEVLYVVAFELGHIVYGDPFLIALIESGIIIFGSALAVVIADRVGFRRDDDSLSRLALVGALMALLYLGAVPLRDVALRAYDFRADRYAVALTGDPAAAVRTLVRGADQRLDQVCPNVLATAFLGTSPGVGVRVATINGVPSGCP